MNTHTPTPVRSVDEARSIVRAAFPGRSIVRHEEEDLGHVFVLATGLSVLVSFDGYVETGDVEAPLGQKALDAFARSTAKHLKASVEEHEFHLGLKRTVYVGLACAVEVREDAHVYSLDDGRSIALRLDGSFFFPE